MVVRGRERERGTEGKTVLELRSTWEEKIIYFSSREKKIKKGTSSSLPPFLSNISFPLSLIPNLPLSTFFCTSLNLLHFLIKFPFFSSLGSSFFFFHFLLTPILLSLLLSFLSLWDKNSWDLCNFYLPYKKCSIFSRDFCHLVNRKGKTWHCRYMKFVMFFFIFLSIKDITFILTD